MAALASGLAPGAASADDHSRLSFFPGYLYLLPPLMHPAPAVDVVAPVNTR